MISIEKTSMKGKVLAQLVDGRLLVYYKGNLVVYGNDEKALNKIKLPGFFWRKFACKVRIFERAMHNDVRWAVEVKTGVIVFLYGGYIYKLDLKSWKIVKEYGDFRGNPFSATMIRGNLYFGDYGGNKKRGEVHVYMRDSKTEVYSCVYKFSKNTVRHIHNIVANENETLVYILTGDEDNEYGIWVMENDWGNVRQLIIGQQQYRYCPVLLSPTEKYSGWYLTDTPSEKNHLYSFKSNSVKMRMAIPGTVIYGKQFAGGLLFSTTVEADAHCRNRIAYWCTNKPGKGMENKYTYLCFLFEGKVYILNRYLHDGMPLRLFQYGTIYFSNELQQSIYYSPCSVKLVDNQIFRCMKE